MTRFTRSLRGGSPLFIAHALRQSLATLACWSSLAFASVATAQPYVPHSVDIVINLEQGQLTTNSVNSNVSTTAVVPQRIFLCDLGTIAAASDPGFDMLPQGSLIGTAIGFDLLAPLRKFDGFAVTLVPTDTVCRIKSGPRVRFCTPVDQSPVTGFTTSVTSTGTFHNHYTYALFQDLDLTPVNANQDGIYLLKMRLTSTSPNVQPSLPFWLVLRNNASDTDVSLALRWVAYTNLACSPADIADGSGEPLWMNGFNPVGPDGGDFDCFFNYYFAPAPDNAICDIAYGDGEPLPPFGPPDGFNPGVDGGDFDCFFNYYFNGCL